MIKTAKPLHGRPGDLFLITPPAVLAVSGLDSPGTRHGTVFDLGLALEEPDMRAVADAMRQSYATAFPGSTGELKLPIRRTRLGTWLLFAETRRLPVVLDGDGAPIPPPPVGSTITINARIAPFRRPDQGRQGVGLYLNRVQLAPVAAIASRAAA